MTLNSTAQTNSIILSTPPSPSVCTQVVDRIPAKRTRVLVAALEPLVKTGTMERILAGLASLVRHLLIGTNDAIADSTFRLAFESADNVTSERGKPVYDAAALFCAC